MRMQMWSSVRVVVQIITGPVTVNGAEFATGFSKKLLSCAASSVTQAQADWQL
jgi:hypothetical protein